VVNLSNPLLSMLISVASHLTSILLSMSFVNALNEAGRDADVIRMFGEGQGFKATVKTANAFVTGIASMGVGVLTMIGINFHPADAVACAVIAGEVAQVALSRTFEPLLKRAARNALPAAQNALPAAQKAPRARCSGLKTCYEPLKTRYLQRTNGAHFARVQHASISLTLPPPFFQDASSTRSSRLPKSCSRARV